MGYYMDFRDSNFSILKENFENALSEIKKLSNFVNKYGSGGSFYHKDGLPVRAYHYSWVNTEEFANAKTLNEAMAAWRWPVEMNANGDIDGINFSGQKCGDDDILFQAIAKYVKDGSYIEMCGEDGKIWRWCFENGQCVDKEAKMIF